MNPPARHLAAAAALSLLAACAWPGPAGSAVPSRPGVDSLVIREQWDVLSPASPRDAEWRLVRTSDGFAGTGRFTVGKGIVLRRDSVRVRVPAAAARVLLDSLFAAELGTGPDRGLPPPDDLWTQVSVTVYRGADSTVFSTLSPIWTQGPRWWRLHEDGRRLAGETERPGRGMAAVLPHLERERLEALVQAVMDDPDAACGPHIPVPGPPIPVEERRYAGGRDWFEAGEPIHLHGHRYEKHGLARYVSPRDLTLAGEFLGVPVYAAPGASDPPEYLYVPARSRCDVQPYRLESSPDGASGPSLP